MREIKFRVWDAGTKCMHQPALKLLHGEHTSILERTPGSVSTPKNWTWLEYTGLKDKNGNDVYEGDIVRFGKKSLGNNKESDYLTYPIVWSETRGAWVFDDGERDYYRTWNAYIYDDLEVVGNIWES